MISETLEKHIKYLRTDDDRADYYAEKWHEWAIHELDLRNIPKAHQRLVRSKLRDAGLYEWEDYIFRMRRIRFKNADDFAICQLMDFT